MNNSALPLIIISSLVLNIVLSGIVAYAASQKGRSGVGFFFLSFLFSFLVGILVVLALPRRDRQVGPHAAQATNATCPYCKEEVKPDALVCKHCGRDIQAIVEARVDPPIAHEMGLSAREVYLNSLSDEQKAGLLAKETRRARRFRFVSLVVAAALTLVIAILWTLSIALSRDPSVNSGVFLLYAILLCPVAMVGWIISSFAWRARKRVE